MQRCPLRPCPCLPALLPAAGVARFAQKYPSLLDALLKSLLELVCKYHKTGVGVWVGVSGFRSGWVGGQGGRARA